MSKNSVQNKKLTDKDNVNKNSVQNKGLTDENVMSKNSVQETMTDVSGKKGAINEEEAKALIAEDAKRLEGELKPKNRGKILAVVIFAVVMMVVIGVGVAWLVTNNGASDEGDKTSGSLEMPGVEGDKNEQGGTPIRLEVDLEDVEVKKLTEYIETVTYASMMFSGLENFYTDAEMMAGRVPDKMMVDMVMSEMSEYDEDTGEYLGWKTCKMPDNEEAIKTRYESDLPNWDGGDEEWMEWAEYSYGRGCLDGDTVREKVREFFGKEITLAEDLEGAMYGYDSEYDEFYEHMGGIGGIFPIVLHVFEKAETDGERIYIDEIAVGSGEVETDQWGKAVWGMECGEEVGICESFYTYAELGLPESETYDEMKEFVADNREKFSSFRWTFVKNEEGNYVFEGVEKIR